jgi:hypothetical protein
MNWRIYRLPGSRTIWHIDRGADTPVINVHGFQCIVDSRSVDIGGNNSPRAWIEIQGNADLHVIDGTAIFSMNVDCLTQVAREPSSAESAE